MALCARTITQKLTVSTSAPSVVDGNGCSIPYPVTIAAVPGGGGALKVEYQVAADEAVRQFDAILRRIEI